MRERGLWFDRDGMPIDMMTASALFADDEYKRVESTYLGRVARVWVSTVWLGLDHSFSDEGPPLIFESMVFPVGDYSELESERYATVNEARMGHLRMMTYWRPFWNRFEALWDYRMEVLGRRIRRRAAALYDGAFKWFEQALRQFD